MDPSNYENEPTHLVTKSRSAGGLSKNRRVSQACEKCRHRKDKCDGRRPRCSTCVKRNQVCSYDPQVKKRGLPEGYVRDLESYKQRLDGYVSDLETTCSLLLQRDGELYGRALPTNADEPSFSKGDLFTAWNDDNSGEKFRDIWRQSEIFEALRIRHPRVERLDDQSNRKKQVGRHGLQGEDGHHELDAYARSAIVMEEPSTETAQDHGSSQAVEKSSEQPFQTLQTPNPGFFSNPATWHLELPAHAWHLINIYFSHTHSWLPIVEKHNVLRSYHELSKNNSGTPRMAQVSGSDALLWSILTLSNVQHASISALPAKKMERAPMLTESMYLYARSIIPPEDGVFEIGHVQALLILSLFKLGTRNLQAAWLLSGQAVRIAFQLGLHEQREEILQNSSISIKSRQKHVFLGCFAIDTLVSARLGRPPHLTTNDIDIIGGMIEESGLEEWDSWSNVLGSETEEASSPQPPMICSTFNKLIATLRSLNSLNRPVFDLSAVRETPTDSTDATESSHTKVNGPDQLALASIGDETSLPHHFNLHLMFLTVKMRLLLRRYEFSIAVDATKGDLMDLSLLVHQTMQTLSKFEESFGVALAPPTTEYVASVLCQSYSFIERHAQMRGSAVNEDWKSSLQILVSIMYKVWPVFGSLREILKMPSMMEDVSDEVARQTDYSFIPNLTSNFHSTSLTHNTTVQEVNGGTNIPHGVRDSPLQSGTDCVNLMSGFTPRLQREHVGMAQFSKTPQSVSPDTRPTSISTNPIGPFREEYGQESTSTFANESPNHNILISTSVDSDGMFNKFTVMDAMEWTGTYDQSLLNLGFTSSDNMNQYFYELHQDPKMTL